MLCYNRSKGWDCPQKSALLEVYEYQIEQYLEMFHIPEDYQAKILEAHKKLQTAYDDTEKEQTRLKAQLERLKKLFAWGDLSEKQYLAEKENTLETLRALTPPETKSRVLEGLAEFLKNVAKAWREANQEQRNKLARQLAQRNMTEHQEAQLRNFVSKIGAGLDHLDFKGKQELLRTLIERVLYNGQNIEIQTIIPPRGQLQPIHRGG